MREHGKEHKMEKKPHKLLITKYEIKYTFTE